MTEPGLRPTSNPFNSPRTAEEVREHGRRAAVAQMDLNRLSDGAKRRPPGGGSPDVYAPSEVWLRSPSARVRTSTSSLSWPTSRSPHSCWGARPIGGPSHAGVSAPGRRQASVARVPAFLSIHSAQRTVPFYEQRPPARSASVHATDDVRLRVPRVHNDVRAVGESPLGLSGISGRLVLERDLILLRRPVRPHRRWLHDDYASSHVPGRLRPIARTSPPPSPGKTDVIASSGPTIPRLTTPSSRSSPLARLIVRLVGMGVFVRGVWKLLGSPHGRTPWSTSTAPQVDASPWLPCPATKLARGTGITCEPARTACRPRRPLIRRRAAPCAGGPGSVRAAVTRASARYPGQRRSRPGSLLDRSASR